MKTLTTSLSKFLLAVIWVPCLFMAPKLPADMVELHDSLSADASAGKDWNLPKFTAADAAKGCVKPVKGQIPSMVCIVDQDNKRAVITFDAADRLAKDKNWANDVWVVGAVY